MLLVDKYKPSSQKSLFHKNIISHIRNWIKLIDDLHSSEKSVNKILFLYGPIGSGKTASINVLFKSFNLYKIDVSDLRSDKFSDILTSIPHFNEVTLSNIDKWNNKNQLSKFNILYIDNLEFCDKSIMNILDTIHNKYKINIPIILICNNPKLKELFTPLSNCTLLEFNKPSLLELSKLISEINTNENLNLSKDNIRSIIDKSQFDIRQLFFILQQWTYNSTNSNFEHFINNLELKHMDIDLYSKLSSIFNTNVPFNLKSELHNCVAEPLVISHHIFQNYNHIMSQLQYTNTNTNNTNNNYIDFLKKSDTIVDNISHSNLIYQNIFEDQNWDLYDFYTMNSCIFPIYSIKSINTNSNNQNSNSLDFNTNIEQKIYSMLQPFKDVSYNYQNSFDEIKKIILQNSLSNILPISPDSSTDFLSNSEQCFFIAKILIHNISILNSYFDNNKRGKNTSKKEKLEICDNITDPSIQQTFTNTLNLIYKYKLFEFDTDYILLNLDKYTITDTDKTNKTVATHDDFTKLDLRILKRFINIFSLNDNTKFIKSHVEMSLKYKLFYILISDLQINYKSKIINHNKNKNIDSLIDDLSNIWNI
jgi:DNA polymerase III delta prime subunit